MSNKNPIGRPPGDIFYQEVVYNHKEYVIGTCFANGVPQQFVFDKDESDKVIGRSWHTSAEKYIGSASKDDGKRKQLFLHNLIANKLDHPGKGTKETIDHINRIGFDNRKENLRFLTQSEQNMNQTKRHRSITLPEGCGVNPEDIPRHIWYIKAHGAHGDRFAIEFKSEGLCWKTTSSKKVSLKNKLQEAKEKLQEFYTTYPQLNPFDTTKVLIEESLRKSYEEILSIAASNTIT